MWFDDLADAAFTQLRKGALPKDLESQNLEFKAWKPPAANDRDALKAGAIDVAEAAACLANARGGIVVVGIDDETGRLSGIPAELTIDELRHRIWRLTSPNLTVDVVERHAEGARVLVVLVEPLFDLVRVAGKLRERIGSDCVPMSVDREIQIRDDRRQYDWSAEPTELTVDGVSAAAIDEARHRLREAGDAESRRRVELTPADLLRECGVLVDERLNRAGALLFSEPTRPLPDPLVQYLRRRSPGGELSRPPANLAAPLLVVLADAFREIDAFNETRPLTLTTGVQMHLETIPKDAAREAVINAVAHRDYRQPGPVVIEHSPAQLVVTSPGELVFGVTEQNLLTHVSKPRNRVLTDALRVLRLAERAGTGIDTMVRAMVRAGHEPPVFVSADGQVRVVLHGGAPVARLASLIAELPDELRDDTDTALVIHYLRTHPTVDAKALAPVIQKTNEEAAQVLRRLSDEAFGLIEPTREQRRYRHPSYRFRERPRAALGTLLPYHRTGQDEIDRRIIAHLREYPTISNQTVQNLFQVGVPRASAILRSLADRSIIQKTADSPERGPSVRYERGPNFPRQRGKQPENP